MSGECRRCYRRSGRPLPLPLPLPLLFLACWDFEPAYESPAVCEECGIEPLTSDEPPTDGPVVVVPAGVEASAELGMSAQPPVAVRAEAPPEACGARGQRCCSGAPACESELACDAPTGACVRCAAFQPLGFYPGHTLSVARAISGDGRVVAGWGQGEGIGEQALRWDLAAGSVSMLPTLPGASSSFARAISGDGQTIVGFVVGSDGLRSMAVWRGDQVLFRPDYGGVYAANADGSVFVGSQDTASSLAFRWEWESGELVSLGSLEGMPYSTAYGINADGSVIVGDAARPPVLGSADPATYQAFRWTRAAGMQSLGLLSGGANSTATASNADGSVVVGLADGPSGGRVFRWTETGGLLPIAPARFFADGFPIVNAAGSVVVGGSYDVAFVWDAESGQIRELRDLLGAALPSDWDLGSATAMSADGLTIAGHGVNPNQLREAWVAVLGPQCAAADEGSAALSPDAGGAAEAGACGSFRALALPVGHTSSRVSAISLDGSVAAGRASLPDGTRQAVRWDLGTGAVEALGGTEALVVNTDGSLVLGSGAFGVVPALGGFSWSRAEGLLAFEPGIPLGSDATGAVRVGFAASADGAQHTPFRWSLASGTEPLPIPESFTYGEATGVSGDGTFTVGWADPGTAEFLVAPRGLGWRGASPPIDLGALPGGTMSLPSATNADGSVVVGIADSPGGWHVFRWTASDGMRAVAPVPEQEPLLWPPRTDASGARIVGTSRRRAFVWDTRSQTAWPLTRLLGEQVPKGWILRAASGVSADGRVVVGYGASPDFEEQAWVAVLGADCPLPAP